MANFKNDKQRLKAATQVRQEYTALGVPDTESWKVYNDILNGTINSWSEINNKIKEYTDTANEINDIHNRLKGLLGDNLEETKKIIEGNSMQATQIRNRIKLELDNLNAIESSGKVLSKSGKELKAQLQTLMGIIEQVDKMKDAYGGFYGAVTGGLGALKKSGSFLKTFLPKFLDDAVDAGLASIEKMIKAGNRWGVVLGVATAALAGIVAILESVRKDAQRISEQTGLTVKQTTELVKQSYELQRLSENRLATQKEILDSQIALVSAFGNLNLISSETVLNVAQMSDAFGTSVENVAKVQQSFEQLGNVSPELAGDMIAAMSTLAEAGGVSPGKVMEDIASNAEVASKYFAGQVPSLVKSALEMRKLSLSLADAAKISEGLLDIESSLTAQFEASAIAGKIINLDTARRLAIYGDITGAVKAALTEIGSYDEFLNMIPLSRAAMAKSLGLTTDQLQRSLYLQEKIMDLSSEEVDLITLYGDQLGNIQGLSSQEIAERAKSVQASEQLATQLEKIRSDIMPGFIRLAEALTPIINFISWAVGGLVENFGALPSIASILLLRLALFPKLLRSSTIQAWALAGAMRSQAIASALSSSFINPAKALVGLAAATLLTGFIVKQLTKQDDMIMSPVGPSGYSRVLSGPEGKYAHAINDKDTIFSVTDPGGSSNNGRNYNDGTNLGGSSNNGRNYNDGTNLGGSSNNGRIEQLLAENNRLMREIGNRPIIIGRDAVGAIGEQIKVNNSYT